MHAQMTALGAAWYLDYIRHDVAQRTLALAGGPVDAIADLVGGTLAAAALALLDRWSGSSWTATEAPLPPNAATNPGPRLSQLLVRRRRSASPSEATPTRQAAGRECW